jgi:1,2-diacylglycerol 3-beta-galactosyltransferase
VTLVYIDAGGGHRAAAVALRDAIRIQGRPWDVELVSIQDVFDPYDFIRKSTGTRSQDVYNIMLRRGWTLGTAQWIPVMHSLIRASHGLQVRALEAFWKGHPSDLVVSLIPHYNRALKESLDRIWPGTPYVTVLTDLADYPPHFWIEQMDQWVICGSNRAVAQALEIGIPEERILCASGMILNPAFYAPANVDRTAERTRLGLKPDLPTGLVLFGAEGSMEMLRIVRALNRARSEIQLILACGRNEAVAARLRAISPGIPMLVLGFTREIPLFMELSDFFIGKAGPGSISEALAKRLPVIVQRNAWTMAHELYNTRWVEDQGVGIVIERFPRDVSSAVSHLLAPRNYAKHRERAAAMRNFAVFEIPEMLSEILGERNARHAPSTMRGPRTALPLPKLPAEGASLMPWSV